MLFIKTILSNSFLYLGDVLRDLHFSKSTRNYYSFTNMITVTKQSIGKQYEG
jgi:hypothetical protein